MATIDVYDIANNQWYQQPSTGPPPQLTRGCAVVASAKDGSSFNIYWYGGYDGLHPSSAFNDDVWVLSLPAFMWVKLSSGTPSHGRAGHKCVTPYPDQMFVMGGSAPLAGEAPTCLNDNILQVFNLTSGLWLDSYDPKVWSEYGVPDKIVSMIGGSKSGGATVTAPSPTGWATPALGSVFATPYPTAKIAVNYPYGSAGPSSSNARPTYTQSGSSVPSWVPPLLGVIGGLMLLSAIAVTVLLYRRRKLLRNSTASDPSTDENGIRIFSWLRGQGTDHKTPTLTTSTEDPEMETRSPVRHEMADTQIAELMGSLSARTFLFGRGLPEHT